MSLSSWLRAEGYPEFIDGELVFPLFGECRVCRKPLVRSVFSTCDAHRFRRDGALLPPLSRPGGDFATDRPPNPGRGNQ